MKRVFTLQPNRWYAAEFFGDEFPLNADLRSYSPIYVASVTPKKSGKRLFELAFYHANYPEGVRDKIYSLQTLERGVNFALVRSTEHSPLRMMLIYSISWDWLRKHFNIGQPADSGDLEKWLSSNL